MCWQIKITPHRGQVARAFKPDKPTIFDVRLSPFGARLRYIIYSSGLQDAVNVKSPAELGGLKSDEYLALHPAGKMPLMVLPSGQALPEATVIQDYLLEALAPDSQMRLSNPEERAAAAVVVRMIDLYYSAIMGCMYKTLDIETRAKQIGEVNDVLDTLEGLCEGPYFVGGCFSTADAAAFPHFVFMLDMLPRYFGWTDVFAGRPKLSSWWATVQEDKDATKVIEEMRASMQKWHEGDRWATVGIKDQVATPGYKWAY